MESLQHAQLKQVALRWLRNTGCVVFGMEISMGYLGIIDAAGLKANGDLYVVEAKISTSDLRADTRSSRRTPKAYKLRNSSMVNFVYYIAAHGVDTSALPADFGILHPAGVVKRRAIRRNPTPPADRQLGRYSVFARSLSWRAYGHVIRGETQQLEFSI